MHNTKIIYLIYFFLLVNGGLKLRAQHTHIYTHEDALYREGLELLDKKLYLNAQQKFQAYIRRAEDNEKKVYVRYNVAWIALKLQAPDAEALLEDFVRQYPDHPKAIDAYLEWGNEYYKNQDYDRAIDYFEKIQVNRLSSEQKDELNFKLGLSYFQKKNYNQAERYFNELKEGFGPYAYAASYYAGYIEHEQGRLDQALQDLQRASQDKTYEDLVPILITDIYYQQQRYFELVNYSTPLLNLNPNLKQINQIYLLTGDAHYYQQNYQNALSFYRSYLGLINERAEPEVLYRVGFCQYQNRSYADAVESLKTIADENSAQGQFASYYLGLSYLQLDNKRFAVNSLERAKKLTYEVQIEQETTWMLAKLYYELERYEDAIQELQYFLDNYPQHPARAEALDLLSDAYLYTKAYEQAITYIESLPQRSPSISTAYQQVTFSRGAELFNQGNYQAAIPYFQKSNQNAQMPVLQLMARFWTAEALVLSENSQAAIPFYQNILSVFGQNNEYILKSHYGLGYAYYNVKQYERAIPHFQFYATQGGAQGLPFVQDALVRLADCYYAQRDYNQALNLYGRAIQQNFGDQDYAYFQRGVILNILNQTNEATSSFETLIQQFPNSIYHDRAIYQKAQVELQNGSYAVAVNDFSSLIDRGGNTKLIPEALLGRALAYTNIGNQNAAIEDYKRIVNEYTTHPDASAALLSVQELLNQAGRQNELPPLLAKYREANPNSQTAEKVYFENAKTAYFNQQYGQAVTLLNQYLDNYPNSPFIYDAQYYLADSYYRLGDTKRALLYYQTVVYEGKSTFLARSARRAADLEYDQENYQSAVSFYRILASNTESKREQVLAWTGLMESYFALNRYDSLNYFADQIINKGDVAGARNTALLYKGKVAYQQQQYQTATQIFQQITQSSSDETGAEAQYLLADIYYRQRRYQESLETLFEMNKKFNFEKWRGKAFLLIADNYIALGETFQAKATLQSIIDKSPDPAVVSQAQQKLAGIQ